VFDVTVDGRVVFSKKAFGRFPEEGEIASLLSTKSPPLPKEE
jgi:hypothetical protein